jgi:peptide/nickel transport system substrate-binding protein
MLAFSMLSAVVLLLSACGGTPVQTGPSSSTPQRGGTWIDDLYEEPTSLIPNASVETYAVMVNQTIWAPLFYTDGTGAIRAGLAQDVPSQSNGEISADLKTWTFKLKPNLVWSDGQPLNADDVDFTWKLWDNPKFAAASTIGFNLIQSADVSADKLSITFHLKQPFVPFVSVWTDAGAAPMPAHVYSQIPVDQILKSNENLKPSVSSGPWMVSESVHGDHYTVVRNPKYYQAAQGYPYLDSIVFKIVTNQDTILSDFQAGSITSSWFLDVTKTPAYKALTNYHIGSNPKSLNYEALYFNLNNTILKDVNIRKAMAMAINQQTLIQNARFGNGTPLCTDHAAGYTPVGYEPNAPCPKYDPTAAGQILQQDGWTMGSNGYRAKGGKTLEFSYSTTANNAWRKADSLILQSEMKAIGVKLDITYYPASTFFGTILPNGKPGQYDVAEFENNFGADPDDSSGFACSAIPSAANSFGGGNFSFYCNHQLDALFTQEQSVIDPTKRQQIFNQIHQIYLTDYPFVTLYSPVDLAVVKNNTHNYLPNPGGPAETGTAWTWWCDGGKC